MNPTLVFILIGFGVPWIGWSIVAIAGDELTRIQRTALFYTGDFCSIAGIVATYVAGGKSGLHEFWRRCIEWRAQPWVWMFIFVVPAVITLVAVQIWGSGEGHVLGSAALLAFFSTPGLYRSVLSGPLGEELGWRGYLLPRLLKRFAPLTASVVLGVIWSIWHFPLYVHSTFSTFTGALGFTVTTVCYSIIMTALYNHSRRSILIAVLCHWMMNTIPNGVFHMYGNLNWQMVETQIICGYVVVTIIVLLVLGKDLKRRGAMVPATI